MAPLKPYFSDSPFPMELANHKNTEKVIRYYLLFLPPRGTESILDIGSGISAPYKGNLKVRCKKYKSYDLRPGYNVDIVGSILDMNMFKNNEFEWGWCVEVLEHIPPDMKQQAVEEILRVCKNVFFTYPTPEFVMKDKDGKVINSFYHDEGHTEVKIDWEYIFGDTHEITDKTTKNGRAIFILKSKEAK